MRPRPTLLALTLAASGGLFACKASPAAKPLPPEYKPARAAVLPASPDDSADAPLQGPAAADRRPRLVCFGDSITAGYNLDPGESYPDDLQKLLDQTGYKYRVVNEGISGNTTKDGLARVDRIVALQPSLVVVELGGNDGLRGIPVADSRQNLDRILGRLKSAGIPFVLAGITLPPSYGADYIQQFNETYTLLAKKYKAPLLPFLYQGIYGKQGMIQPDGIHPTAPGSELVARNILNLLQPLLKK